MQAWWEDINRRAHWDRIGAFALGAAAGALIGVRLAPQHKVLAGVAGAAAGCGAAYGAMIAANPSIANL